MLQILISTLLITCMTASAQDRSSAGKRDDLSGSWILIEQFRDETHHHRMNLEVTGDKITGQSGSSKIEGTIANSVLTLKWLSPDGQRVEATYTGKMQNGVLEGDGVWYDIKLQWSARRPVARPSGGPRTHTFTPTEFHRVFSSAIPPVLRIFPGDTVQTKSVGADGIDENSVRRSMGGNPLTGPFFIEGALPGDTLVIRLNRVRTNRDWAVSGQSVVGNALTPGYLMNLNRAKSFSNRWKLDREKGIAFLEKPTDPLKNFTVPLQPMLGCVGVAPPGREVIRTGDSGIFGGNMDYNQLREGTTVYLPVFHEGALLFMGDGHAAQGDGELTGDALETSIDFEFTVELVSEKSIGTPRAENTEYLMAIGIGGSLDQAMQRATAEMARWLESDYKLNSTESAIILGFAVKYDVADLVGTQVSIVAKIPKNVVAQLNRQ
ncbi:MAG: acetamidase/formamidase family protein [Acidobacteria bacterium]|nr:acetamidase/formamidase family protein [Acidobacteriota bacterium]MCI0663362.1 acetamidase/formamidase family protein [Acidobacteriota bacterium]